VRQRPAWSPTARTARALTDGDLVTKKPLPTTAPSTTAPSTTAPGLPAIAATAPTEVSDPATGLRASVTYAPGAIVVRAALPCEIVEPPHVRAFVLLALGAARQHAGRSADPDYLAGYTYTVSRYADGRWFDPAAADTVRLDQVGGLPDVVEQLREVAVSFRHPAAMARWGARRPQGILMYGPPGTGKTMLARALATEIGGTLREIRTPEILNKYVGESERNIKRIFEEAKRYTEPTVLFFDEFDSIISYTGAAFDAASQMFNGVAGIFKQEMNTLIEVNPNVIVVATTNFPERVDKSLIRSGRFDILIPVPRPDRASRADILGKILRGLIARYEVAGFRMFADDVDIAALADVSDGLTGADVKEVLRRLQLAKAMAEARGGGCSAPITQADLERGIADLRGSRGL
jgi:transitional endoplasmic reticulum ATPase